MKTKAQKKESIDALEQALPSSTITIFTTFARAGEPGLSVAQLQELKRALRRVEGEYVVAKKTLINKAMQDLQYLPAGEAGEGLDVFSMDGSMGLVLAHGDVYTVAKALHQFAKANPALKMFGAWSNGKALSLAELTEMAVLPSRDELIAHLLGMMKYPLSSLAVVLDQVAKQKQA
jgi:large subunit ribosomal protein L10